VLDAHSGKDADGPHRRTCLLLARGCVSWHRNRVVQSAEPKEMRFAVSGTMDKVVGGERGCGLVAHLAYGEQLTWGRKQWDQAAAM
jgi:hypothetical protein